MFTAYPDYTQLSSSMDGWHFSVVGLSESLQQQWSDWAFEEDLTANALDIAPQLEDMRDLEDGWADGMQPAANWGEGFGLAPSPRASTGWPRNSTLTMLEVSRSPISTQHQRVVCKPNGLWAQMK